MPTRPIQTYWTKAPQELHDCRIEYQQLQAHVNALEHEYHLCLALTPTDTEKASELANQLIDCEKKILHVERVFHWISTAFKFDLWPSQERSEQVSQNPQLKRRLLLYEEDHEGELEDSPKGRERRVSLMDPKSGSISKPEDEFDDSRSRQMRKRALEWSESSWLGRFASAIYPRTREQVQPLPRRKRRLRRSYDHSSHLTLPVLVSRSLKDTKDHDDSSPDNRSSTSTIRFEDLPDSHKRDSSFHEFSYYVRPSKRRKLAHGNGVHEQGILAYHTFYQEL